MLTALESMLEKLIRRTFTLKNLLNVESPETFGGSEDIGIRIFLKKIRS